MSAQGEKLSLVVGAAVGRPDSPDVLRRLLTALDRRHGEYGVLLARRPRLAPPPR